MRCNSSGPDGEKIIGKTTWDRRREHSLFFEAKKVGAYLLSCRTRRR
jgi:hypothetical protein